MPQKAEPAADMGSLRLTCQSSDAGIRVAATGDLDVATVPQLELVLRDAQADADVVILDLRALRFMGCGGVELMLATDDRARRRGGHLVVVRGSPEVERLFALVAIDRLLHVVDRPPDELSALVPSHAAALDAA